MNETEVRRRMAQYEDILSKAPQICEAVRQTYSEYEKKSSYAMSDSSHSGQLYLAVYAPALIGFTEWVLKNALDSGRNRIYFLSRDGWQMYLIASRIVQARSLPVECRYLNVSRYSMKVPGYHLDIDKSIDSICFGGIDVTPLRILKRAALTDEECSEVLEELGRTAQAERILNYQEVIRFRDSLRQSSKVKEYIYTHSAAAYSTAVNYLVQEGLCDDAKYAIVDSGWIGTLQCSIEKLVRSVNPDISVHGYYFGLYELPKEADKDRFHAYYFTPDSGLRNKCMFSNSLFETIVSSDEGMTAAYEENNGIYCPVKLDGNNPNSAQMNNNIKLLEHMLDRLSFGDGDRPLIEPDTVYSLFRLFMAEPTQLEVSAYGDNRFSDNVLDDGYKSVAAMLSVEQIRNQRFMNKLMIVLGIKKAVLRESAWLEGSAVRAYEGNTRKIKSELRHIRLYKRFIYLRKQMKA